MAYLFWPNEARLKSKGYESVAHVPAVFSSSWKYDEEASRHLRERALAEWAPADPEGKRFGSKRYLTKQSLRALGHGLCNFFEWCERKGLDWRSVEYTQHLVKGYQAEMLTGSWSADGRALKASTVNQRVSNACQFLQWASDRQLRPAFQMLFSSTRVKADSARSAHGHKALQAKARVGAPRQAPTSLRIPTDAEVIAWMARVKIERGETKALMCELILASGIRREEATQWRVDTLPLDRNDWRVIGDHVEVLIKYGAKGPKQDGPQGEEGPPRHIAIPLSLANRLDHYRQFSRTKAKATYVKNAKDPQERRERMRKQPSQLFISEATGEGISSQVLYDAWTSVSKLPYKGWSPHTGRHYWACKKLLEALSRRMKAAGASAANPAGWASDFAIDTLSLVIKPQLGHVSEETTQKYLVWIHRAFTLNTLQGDYEKSLEELIATPPATGEESK